MLNIKTLEFFRELRENNHKAWFDVNRHRYEEVKKDYHRLIEEILLKMQQFDKSLSHLQVKDCTFRINRDIRFSKNKTPYKTHLSIIMSPYGKRMEYAAYYVHLDEQAGSFAGGGIYMPGSEALKKIRAEISGFYEDLEDILNSKDFAETFQGLDSEGNVVLTRPPKGYDAQHPAIDLLKYKSFTATKPLDNKLLTDPKGVEVVTEILKKIKPLNDFINRGLTV
ncbi:MAG: DUF2461 domain-containing protein [Bacteroidetes bacterium]|nr:MAG: DUF2461 domain-containing protein [Bacteroidota bacterium]